MDKLDVFEADTIYHVYSHGNANDLLFREKTNYVFFLERIKTYLLPICEIYAYCLIPNHFHLLLKLNENTDQQHSDLMKPFSNLLNSYAKAYNKKYGRKGALFLDFIKRKRVENEKYLLKLLHYIHNNPVEHGLVAAADSWPYSSYNAYLEMKKKSNVSRDYMMSYFDDISDFIAFHKSNIEYDF
ncbi:MAG: transposase [Chryseobacterium sp.]|nr:MAG: transposase [Chryseobacterium sp.]